MAIHGIIIPVHITIVVRKVVRVILLRAAVDLVVAAAVLAAEVAWVAAEAVAVVDKMSDDSMACMYD